MDLPGSSVVVSEILEDQKSVSDYALESKFKVHINKPEVPKESLNFTQSRRFRGFLEKKTPKEILPVRGVSPRGKIPPVINAAQPSNYIPGRLVAGIEIKTNWAEIETGDVQTDKKIMNTNVDIESDDFSTKLPRIDKNILGNQRHLCKDLVEFGNLRTTAIPDDENKLEGKMKRKFEVTLKENMIDEKCTKKDEKCINKDEKEKKMSDEKINRKEMKRTIVDEKINDEKEMKRNVIVPDDEN